MGLIRVSNQAVVKIETIKISVNICYCLLKRSIISQDIASISNRRAISSEILKGNSISNYSIRLEAPAQLIALKHKTRLKAEALTARRSSLKC